jgi:hypothetical protein
MVSWWLIFGYEFGDSVGEEHTEDETEDSSSDEEVMGIGLGPVGEDGHGFGGGRASGFLGCGRAGSTFGWMRFMMSDGLALLNKYVLA